MQEKIAVDYIEDFLAVIDRNDCMEGISGGNKAHGGASFMINCNYLINKKMKRILIAIVAFFSLSAYAQNMADKSALKVALEVGFAQQAIPIADVNSVSGFAGERIIKNRENYLKKFPIDQYMDFIVQRNYREWSWKKAEQHGKWIESSILSSAQSNDEALKKKVAEIFDRLIASQEPEGYLGATDKQVRTPEQPLRGMDAYELYFVQHALLTEYEQYKDMRGLDAAKKLGNYFIQYIGPGKAEFWPGDLRYPDNLNKPVSGHSSIAGHSAHYGLEGTLLIDPMLRLYQLSGDLRYLEWSKWVINNIDEWSGWNTFSKLDSIAAGKMTIDEVQPNVHAHTFHMNFLGFLRMYQITGDSSYLHKVKGVWDDAAQRQMYLTGGVSVRERYQKGYNKPIGGEVVETCATMSWMQLTQYLLELTNNPMYGDVIEKLFWNHAFAAQSYDGDSFRYHTPPNGEKPDGYYRDPDCCTASGHKMISLMPTYIFSTGINEIYINQYVQSSASFANSLGLPVSLIQNTNYPETGRIKIIVNVSGKSNDFTINLRIPSWCKNPSIKVNKQSLENPVSGTYASIKREWKDNDQIEINFPMSLEWVKTDKYNTKSAIYRQPESIFNPMYSDRLYALIRGPVVYTLDNIWWDEKDPDFPLNVSTDVKFIVSDSSKYKELYPKKLNVLKPFLEIPVMLANNKVKKAIFVPFANVGIWYKNVENKPDQKSKAFSYAIFCEGILE